MIIYCRGCGSACGRLHSNPRLEAWDRTGIDLLGLRLGGTAKIVTDKIWRGQKRHIPHTPWPNHLGVAELLEWMDKEPWEREYRSLDWGYAGQE